MIVIIRILTTGLFFFASVIAHSQIKNRLVHGNVITTIENQESIHVLNISSRNATTTDKDGFFAISVGLNDTLVFSAVQLEKKMIIITEAIWNEQKLNVSMRDIINQLDEVIVRPYGLSGDLSFDTRKLNTLPVITASTLNLPNANVKKLSKSERQLVSASAGPFAVINLLTGYTKKLKKRVLRDHNYKKTEMVRDLYSDTLYIKDLGLAKSSIDEFLYFCESDSLFQETIDSGNKLKLLAFLEKKSEIFLKNHEGHRRRNP